MTSKEYRSPVNLPSSIFDEGGINDSNFNYIINIIRNSYHGGFNSISFPASKSKLSNSIFFRFLPPVKTYFRALGAVIALHDSLGRSLSKDEKSKRTTISGYLSESDTGFKELIAILSEHKYFGERTKEVDEICYAYTIITSPSSKETLEKLVQILKSNLFSKLIPWCETVITASVNRREVAKIYYGDRDPLVEFTRQVEDFIRGRLATYAIWSIIAWLVLNTLLLLYVNFIIR